MNVFRIETNSNYPQYVFVEVFDKRHEFEVHIKHEDEGVVVDLYDQYGTIVSTIGACYSDFDNNLISEEVADD